MLVTEKDGKTVQYYLAKNSVTEEFGHVCKGEKQVVATGTDRREGRPHLDHRDQARSRRARKGDTPFFHPNRLTYRGVLFF